MSLANLSSVLSDYERVQPKRASGGIHALAGFNYQLRLYVADLVESLVSDEQDLEDAGNVFFEALSDLAKQEGDFLICVQAKRSLTVASLKDAATEIFAIDNFLALYHPELREQVRFKLVASQGNKDVTWDKLSPTHPAHSLIDELVKEDRVAQPEIQADPGWRAITLIWKSLKDPYGFMRFALDRSLTRINSTVDCQRIRDDICERFSQDRLSPILIGQLLTCLDFSPSLKPSANLEIGREITLARVRDQQYMTRPHRRDALYERLLERHDLSLRDLRSAVRVFWLAGRSGVGKSVLLLQILERLIADGRRVLWLGGNSELLEPALREVINAPDDLRPEFIAIDDLYDRDARTKLDIARLGAFIDETGRQGWPMILTCGPAEFAEAFEEESRYRGFEVNRETLHPVAADEAREVAAWYHKRTGRTPARGPAFEQANNTDGGLFVSLAVELAHGDLKEFALRFAERVRLNDLDDALRLPLALNRLYLRAPYDWLSDQSREKLATLNVDGDFELLESGQVGQVVRLTHPHLADALYRALRKPGNSQAYTNDLMAVFEKALTEINGVLVSQLLRLFSAPRRGLAAERLSIVDEAQLADGCARAWRANQTNFEWDSDTSADIATSWACWADMQPVISARLGEKLFDNAVSSLNSAFKNWTACWMRLAACEAHTSELVAWANKCLSGEKFITHPRWSLVWEHCLNKEVAPQNWLDMGLVWLQRNLRRTDWHFVWKNLLPQTPDCRWDLYPALILALRRLKAENDGPDWAYVLQDLLVFAEGRYDKTIELVILGHDWLIQREDRAEWAFVWRALLKQADCLPKSISLSDLLAQGVSWLEGREDRAEWSFIWRELLNYPEEILKVASREDLLSGGRRWLVGREGRVEWSYVFRALLEQSKSSLSAAQFTDLFLQGYQWLNGHDDQPEWLTVWRVVLSEINCLPPSEVSNFNLLGFRWLVENVNANQWAFVWEELLESLEHCENVSLQTDVLVLGHKWLLGREDMDEWGYVWARVVKKAEKLPEAITIAELWSLGNLWLDGREDKAAWSYVWKALIHEFDYAPESMPFSDLLARGYRWLNSHENQPNWSYVWESLIDHSKKVPEAVPLSEMLKIGSAWLLSREHQADWSFIWQKLVAYAVQQNASSLLSDLMAQGHHWLEGRDGTSSWGFVCEVLLENRYRDRAFLDLASQQLEATTKEKSWPLTAMKFLAVGPDHPASSKLAEELSAQINRCPNSSRWFKNEGLFIELRELSIPVSEELKKLCQTFFERDQAPVWAIAFDRMKGKLPVQGCLVAGGGGKYIIELSIGLVGVWNASEYAQKVIGAVHDFYIHSVNPSRGLVRVGIEPPIDIVVGGIYQGVVSSIKAYGLFVKFGLVSGLLHRRCCGNFTFFTSKYPIGSVISVCVEEETEKGLILTYAGGSSAIVAVGESFEGVISSVVEFGVFVDFEEHSGLIHKSKLPEDFHSNPEFAVMQSICVEVIGIRDDEKIILMPIKVG